MSTIIFQIMVECLRTLLLITSILCCSHHATGERQPDPGFYYLEGDDSSTLLDVAMVTARLSSTAFSSPSSSLHHFTTFLFSRRFFILIALLMSSSLSDGHVEQLFLSSVCLYVLFCLSDLVLHLWISFALSFSLSLNQAHYTPALITNRFLFSLLWPALVLSCVSGGQILHFIRWDFK